MLLLGAACLAACSTPPSITTLEPAEGHPHDVVLLKGSDLESAEIVWDAGEPTEKVIPGGFLGAYMFSVPHGAPAGTHPVVVRKGAAKSTTLTFTVPSTPGPSDEPHPPGPAKRAFPPPRIDAVTLIGAKFEKPSGVRATLYVQGANLDVGAIVSIKNSIAAPSTPVASVSHRVLRNDWFKVPDHHFAYPIYHYSSVIAAAGLRQVDTSIWVVVTNLDGLQSPPFEYRLPKNADEMDSDGDGLTDADETGGHDADKDGVVDVDLKALGADPHRRDILLELDIMDDVEHRPDATVFDALKGMFESAPIINLDDPRGINLVIDTSTGKPCLPNPAGGEKCSFTWTIFDIGGQTGTTGDPFTTDRVVYSQLKKHSFDEERRGKVFHYGLWAIKQPNGRSGWSDDGDDLIISFDSAHERYQTSRSQIEALAHELGHNLGQLHGGKANLPERRPNYLSVMSKTWMHRTGWPKELREERATCLPFYYAKAGATEVSGSVPPDVNTIVDYSEGMGRTLTRPTPSAAGDGSHCDSMITWAVVEPPTAMTVEDFANWPALVFTGPAKDGTLTP